MQYSPAALGDHLLVFSNMRGVPGHCTYCLIVAFVLCIDCARTRTRAFTFVCVRARQCIFVYLHVRASTRACFHAPSAGVLLLRLLDPSTLLLALLTCYFLTESSRQVSIFIVVRRAWC